MRRNRTCERGEDDMVVGSGEEDPRMLGDEDRELLRNVLDEIIPASADGRLPGAGELGVAGYLEESLEQRADLGPLVAQGLSALRARAREGNPEGFSALPRQEKVALLREAERENPAFFGTVLMLTYTGFYTHRRVSEALGMRPHPQPDGYDLEAGDLESLLKAVREGPEKLYREC